MITVTNPDLQIHYNAISTEFKVLSAGVIQHIDPRLRHCQHHTLGSLYTETGKRISLSSRKGGANWDMVSDLDSPALTAVNIPATVTLVRGRTLFLGHFMNHYGHFLTETMSRLWVLESDIQYDNYVFFPFIFDDGKVTAQTYHEFFLRNFGLLGRNIIILRHPAKFEEVHVPEALCMINSLANIKLKEIYDRISKPFRTGHSRRRIFLSRLQPYARIANIPAIESVFRQSDFEIIYPETMKIEEQIECYANARILAGFAGSALHNCVFSPPGSDVIELGDVRSPTESLVMQKVLNRLARTNAHFIAYEGSDTGIMDIERLRLSLYDILMQTEMVQRADKSETSSGLLWPATLTAHLAGIGDVVTTGALKAGDFPLPQHGIEGFAISTDPQSPFAIEYRGRLADGQWTEWLGGGNFVGSRGQISSLCGFAVRIKGPQAQRFETISLGGFAGQKDFISAHDNGDCHSPDRAPLLAIRLLLRLR